MDQLAPFRLTRQSMQRDFKRKGRVSQNEGHRGQLAQMITKERANRLEGSFGTDKKHFLQT